MLTRVKTIKARKPRTRTKYDQVTEKRLNLQREKELQMKSMTMFK